MILTVTLNAAIESTLAGTTPGSASTASVSRSIRSRIAGVKTSPSAGRIARIAVWPAPKASRSRSSTPR